MSWQQPPRGYTDPSYYTDAASDIERNLRADFAKYHLLSQIAPGDTPEIIADRNGNAYEISQRWEDHEQLQFRWLWRQLGIEATQWELDPDATRALYDDLARAREAGEPSLDELSWRTLRQAREVTGHSDDVSSAAARAGAHWQIPGPQLQSITNADNSIRPQDTDRHLRAVPGSGLEAPPNAADRALGAPRQLRLLDMAAVEEVIQATDDLLDVEEVVGDRDTGREKQATLLPAVVRDAPISFDYRALAEQHARHTRALAAVQNLAAEHTRLHDRWGAEAGFDQAQVARLEELSNALKHARREAGMAGVGDTDIAAAYQAGVAGVGWSQQPAHPFLGRLTQLTRQHVAALAEIDDLRSAIAELHDQRGGSRVASMTVEVAAEAARAQANSGSEHGPDHGAGESGGHEIGAAIEAALPEDLDPDWDAQDGVETAPAATPSPQPHLTEELNR
ncbi:hypothetical protein [Nocardia sp. XZ_19_385]|uniref:hypothetical protein n=1 Tax=Nocardia sp. XZ_19_385 TaxID=2769488 RepID=UPI00188E91DC|nr:hypothetical protein [Nocardia sp. XZ_19_385]